MNETVNPLKSVVWKDRIAPALRKAGVDTDQIKPVQAAVLISEAEEFVQGDVADQAWVDEILEEHPSWQSVEYRRRSIVIGLLDGDVNHNDYSEDDLIAGRYVVLAWYDGDAMLYPGGDTLEGVLDVIHNCHYSMEDPELVEAYYDLDTPNGQRYEVSGGAGQLKATISLSLNGASKTYGDNADGVYHPPLPKRVEYDCDIWDVFGHDWESEGGKKLRWTGKWVLRKSPSDRRRATYDWATVDPADVKIIDN